MSGPATSGSLPNEELETVLARLQEARAEGRLSESATHHVRRWLLEPAYAPFAARVADHVVLEQWHALEDAFWTELRFGTAGRRGKMYPIGPNAINDRTVGETAQALADYLRELTPDRPLACCIAFDTRHGSRHFAELCCEVMAANGFLVYFHDAHRSTPQLSFSVRHYHADCGLMISASHNPPSDNAVKVFWSNGAQVREPHDAALAERIARVGEVRRLPLATALANGQVIRCHDEVDPHYWAAVVNQGFPGPRDLKILYSPLHGAGAASVLPVLVSDGFAEEQIELYAPHASHDGDFPNVPDHVANPENPAVFEALVARACASGADLVLASDPDADRIGGAAPLSYAGPRHEPQGWRTFTGNQLAVLLAEYLLAQLRAHGRLTPRHYLVKTLVTTDMLHRQAEAYGIACHGELLTGFKWIGSQMEASGPEECVLACEEAHGYLAGPYLRDKDGAVAAMLLAQYAAQLKPQGRTLHEELDRLYLRYGCHEEKTVSLTLPGAEGMDRMAQMMQRLRAAPPAALAGMRVVRVRDYLAQQMTTAGQHAPLDGPRGDLVVFDLEQDGHRAAVRPSGTEPKIKFYLFARQPASEPAQLAATKAELAARLNRMAAELQAAAGAEL